MDGNGEFFKFKPVEDVFRDFMGRRAGIINALITDFQDLREKCDPEAKNLCLHADANGQWEVKEPDEMVPPCCPEPVIGINMPPDGMPEKEWSAMIAVHSDSWLLSHTYFLGAKLDKAARQRLFTMINKLPTVYEVLKAHREKKDKPNVSNSSGSETESNPRSVEPGSSSRRTKSRRARKKGNIVEDASFDEKEENALCGACARTDSRSGFWICCDQCKVWYHGDCLKITQTMAEQIHCYRCPSCNNGK